MTPPTEPEGWKLTPRLPTMTMIDAAYGEHAFDGWTPGPPVGTQLHAARWQKMWDAAPEAAPPAPVEPMRRALSDEDVERAASAHWNAICPQWTAWDDLPPEGRRDRIATMRAALSVLPPVAGGGEVAGLIGPAKEALEHLVVGCAAWNAEFAREHEAPITRLVDALEGRL